MLKFSTSDFRLRNESKISGSQETEIKIYSRMRLIFLSFLKLKHFDLRIEIVIFLSLFESLFLKRILKLLKRLHIMFINAVC